MKIWISLKLNYFVQTRKLKYKKLNYLIQTKYLQNEGNLNQGNQNAVYLNFLEIFKSPSKHMIKDYLKTYKEQFTAILAFRPTGILPILTITFILNHLGIIKLLTEKLFVPTE